ncbi:transglutaminase-like superfamily protein [Hirsutella rhossiliensis]|uniref:Transglutaminase-like superfamily domain-containing protein n=1 Tax=Hirsutella rhossiliensis TaxID=111463 RepID=A0A9P8N1X5_9HYPO|nr:transglutaminase-like superfamily domain-containing protein [Hirsutella rhossiliensis]KAH0965107.1 transglutaminase-like superfamily domain-containing protein [Hirsutella rhossiliensis]
MVPAPPPLPTQFPCWCRAVYSWGGESKRDLGFIEGDLIECLNAGDGSWWVGRLYRDRRTVGSFPSNFVSLLPEGFRPTTRSASPLPESNMVSPQAMASKSKTFRKPFEAYAKAPHYTSAKQPETFREPPRPRTVETLSNSFSKSVPEGIERVASPSQPRGYGSRAPSPAPPMMREPPRRPSPAPSMMRETHHRHQHHRPIAMLPATASYNHYRQGSSNSYQGQHDLSRQTSYTPPSPGGSHLTPSPLREAMDGVMEQLGQLEGLGGPREAASPAPPFDPWAPESFDLASPRSKRTVPERTRPVTSMGIAHHDEGYETWSGDSSRGTSHQSGNRGRVDEHTQLNSYVERMEKHFQTLHQQSPSVPPPDVGDMAPPPPPKSQQHSRPKTSSGEAGVPERKLNMRKSAHEIGHGVSRTYTTKTNATHASSGNQSNTSSSTQSSGRTLWSGASASGFSSTSAGSYARTTQRAQSALGLRELDIERPETPFTGVTYHSSHASHVTGAVRPASQVGFHDDLTAGIGGLVHPKAPKRNIFKKIFESAKTGVASNRNSIAAGSGTGTSPARSSPFNRPLPQGASPMSSMAGVRGPASGRDAAREMGLGSGVDWVQVRRDVNRSNSLSKSERNERRDRCQMMDHPALNPVDELFEGIEGDEGADGMPVADPLNYQAINLSQVDKNSRFISDPSPSMATAKSLATTYLCRPYRSDVQRLRAIFTWVAENICWEEDFEGEVDTRRVIQSKRGCAEEHAVLVMEMCAAVGLQCEVIRGYLKSPGEVPDLNMVPRSNHWWNAVIVDGEWRILDCCLASPSNPKRGLYSSASGAAADPWWFLARPTEICWTHVPEHHDQQHIVPPVAHEILLNLPCACPAFFRNGIEMVDYNTCATRIEDLEMVHVKFNVPADIEVAAEVEARAYSQDADGDVFESGDVVRKRALAQAEWFNGVKRYTVKALLPGDEGQGTLKIYAGQRGLMHSIKDIPHPLAMALPVIHTGENPPYEFVTRHPTPHAQRHDIYVVQPQCQRLALNNTFVFAIRQHPSSLSSGPQSALTPATNPGATSPIPFLRPSSAMSITASSVGGSNPSSATGIVAGQKPAKLAIQTPGGKILRLMRKEERRGMGLIGRALGSDDEPSDGGTWETIIKCSERGLWRGLVLADRTARWCVFAEWVCVG